MKLLGLRCLALCVMLALGAAYASAQTHGSNRRTINKVSRVKPKVTNQEAIPRVNQTAGSAKQTTGNADQSAASDNNSPVMIVSQPQADYLTGEASVSVNPKQPTVVRLGLAQNATSVIEFPLVDQIYYIHEGNPKLVTVFQSPTKETDRSITLYPGEGFLPVSASGQKELSVTITMQMKSGLVIVLEIVPASGIGQNAHRCVINYNLAEVVAVRRAAGLKVNLGEENTAELIKSTRAVSTLVNADLAKGAELNETENSALPVTRIAGGAPGNAQAEAAKRRMKSGAELSGLINKRLAEAIKSSKERFTVWSPVNYGLSLSTSRIVRIDPLQRLIVVAVKNETTDSLQLLGEMPELLVQTVDKSGNSLLVERLTRKFVETTALSGAIPAGAIVYYALVYENPVLGANQKLLVSCAHDRAADTPVVAQITQTGQREGSLR